MGRLSNEALVSLPPSLLGKVLSERRCTLVRVVGSAGLPLDSLNKLITHAAGLSIPAVCIFSGRAKARSLVSGLCGDQPSAFAVCVVSRLNDFVSRGGVYRLVVVDDFVAVHEAIMSLPDGCDAALSALRSVIRQAHFVVMSFKSDLPDEMGEARRLLDDDTACEC